MVEMLLFRCLNLGLHLHCKSKLWWSCVISRAHSPKQLNFPFSSLLGFVGNGYNTFTQPADKYFDLSAHLRTRSLHLDIVSASSEMLERMSHSGHCAHFFEKVIQFCSPFHAPFSPALLYKLISHAGMTH